MKNIILIGYRCTGKTSVGEKLSERLGLPFFDTDDLIIEQAGMSISKIVEEGGWEMFRKKEKETIKGLSSMDKSIIATGGGAFENQETGEALKKNGLFIWLTADVKTITERMLSDQNSPGRRPSLSHDDLETETTMILKRREPTYRELADFTIDTSEKNIDSITDEICEYIRRDGGYLHPKRSKDVRKHNRNNI
ncbi:MAG: shikimate kinase [Deltaproteobacteria bacterium]|nr:shikimate kinase [Deltaproteobacteria bacterium]